LKIRRWQHLASSSLAPGTRKTGGHDNVAAFFRAGISGEDPSSHAHFQLGTRRVPTHTVGLSFLKNAVIPPTLGRAALCRRLAFPFSKRKRSCGKGLPHDVEQAPQKDGRRDPTV
ncbi:hypothetical protein, partial [uncultured Desulfovibrio sp.]|uniref:hypothetical protein n=1 Tax=uncultured Desulfovibrio sp. TaxID=167968 RepID=UPI0026309973